MTSLLLYGSFFPSCLGIFIRCSSSIALIKSDWKKVREDQYKRHCLVIQHMKENKGPNLDILSKVLPFNPSSKITEEHLALCIEIYDKRISMPLPVPNTKHVVSFVNLVGSERVKSADEVMGCYLIKGFKIGCSNFTGIENIESYIGQAKHLGFRVKDHAKRHDLCTKSFINSLKGEGIVELFIITNDMVIPNGLSKKEFLTLLEQYLIIKLKPTLNKKFVATPGILWSSATIRKHIEKVGSIIYIYKKSENGDMVWIQTFLSGRSVGDNLGLNYKFYSNIKKRSNGWYKNTIYFSEVKLKNSKNNIIPFLEFKELIKDLEIKRIGFGICVIDIITRNTTTYDSMRAVTRAIGIDSKGIKEKLVSGKLYKGRYKFETKSS